MERFTYWFERDSHWEETLKLAMTFDDKKLREILTDMIEYGPDGPVNLGLKKDGSWNMGGHAVGDDE